MALFILCGNGSPSFTQIYMLVLIILVLVCSFSHGSSSSSSSLLGSSNVDIGNNIDNFDNEKNFHGKNNHRYRLLFRPSSSSSIDHINNAEYPIPSKNHLISFLLRSFQTKTEDRPHRQHQIHVNSRRYAPQSFHAMRG